MENKRKEKILVCCGIKGYITSFINYIEALCLKKELFDYVFCIGDFFGHDKSCEIDWEKYKKSRKSVSIPIYILGPNKKEHEKYFRNLKNNELAPNIFYLGKDGIFNTTKGLKIGYISGIQCGLNEVTTLSTFNYNSLIEFKDRCKQSGITSVDMLLTSPWPLDILNEEQFPNNQKIEIPTGKNTDSQLLSWIAIDLTPRYHISGLKGVFYQRSPYKNNSTNTLTRFVGLGNFYDMQKTWQYGVLISPVCSKKIVNCTITKSPYTENVSLYTGNKYKIEPNVRICNFNKFDINTEACWFCLSSHNVSKHLIVSVGDQIYLAGNKGPLVKDHLVIVTVDHYKSFVELPIEIHKEIEILKTSLNEYYKRRGHVAVYYERNVLTAHFQLQVIPVPILSSDFLEHSFKVTFKKYNLNLTDIPETDILQTLKNSSGYYFYVELPKNKCLFHDVDKNNENNETKFPIDIAREVLSSRILLNVQDRIDWRKCKRNTKEEEFAIKLFRIAFKPYNPIKEKNIDQLE